MARKNRNSEAFSSQHCLLKGKRLFLSFVSFLSIALASKEHGRNPSYRNAPYDNCSFDSFARELPREGKSRLVHPFRTLVPTQHTMSNRICLGGNDGISTFGGSSSIQKSNEIKAIEESSHGFRLKGWHSSQTNTCFTGSDAGEDARGQFRRARGETKLGSKDTINLPLILGGKISPLASPGGKSSSLDEETPELPEYAWSDESTRNRTKWSIRSKPIDFEEESGVDEHMSFGRDVKRTEQPDYQQVQSLAESRPVVYQFFGKSLRRSHRSDAVPFVMLGPSVDHWRAVGRILSSRGFNVMACQRIAGDKTAATGCDDSVNCVVHRGDGEALVLKILDALRWERAVIVGCDGEAALAVDAALRLAPERVVGVILCGDLTAAEFFVNNLKPQPQTVIDQLCPYIDRFVEKNITCPSTVVWDGDLFTLPLLGGKTPPKSYESFNRLRRMLEKRRILIVGGGSSPHRRLPDQFAWVLTRFVEEEVVGHMKALDEEDMSKIDESDDDSLASEFGIPDLNSLSPVKNLGCDISSVNPFRDNGPVDQFFSSGSFLVVGRYVARMLLYFSAFKIFLHQYQNLKSGIYAVQSTVSAVNSWQRKGREFASGIITNDWVKKHLSFNLRQKLFPQEEERKESSEDTDSSEEQSTADERKPEESKDSEDFLPSYDDLFYDHRLILIDGVVT